MGAPTPQAVSAFLAKELGPSEPKFSRYSEGPRQRRAAGYLPVYPGFKVTKGFGLPGKVEHVAVTHVLGSRDERLLPARQREITRERLTAYRERLERRYRVTLNDRADLLIIETKDS